MKRETLLELAWQSSSGFGPFNAARVETYHATYGCCFQIPALMNIKSAEQESISIEPTPEWISSALNLMVRDEGAGRNEGVLHADTNETNFISDEIVYDLLQQYEEQISFGEKTEAILKNNNFQQPIDKIAAILSDPTIGNRKNEHELTYAEVKRGLDAACASGGPLIFILPAFPFKDQNLFRSDLPAFVPDFGEVALMIHLHCLSMAINQVFRHDVMWLVVSDGTVYETIFGADPGSAKRYISALRDWRSHLNIDGSIHFIDFDDLIKRYDHENHANPELCFTNIYRKITEILQSAFNQKNEIISKIQDNLTTLAHGMIWNQNWKNEVDKYGIDAIWKVHQATCQKDRIDAYYSVASEELWNKAIQTAIKYAAFNLTSRYTNILSKFMPYAIRATSHVKPGQVGIPRETGVAPWNGLAVYECYGNNRVRVKSLPLCQIDKTKYIRFQLYGGSFNFGFAKQEDIKCYL